MPRHRSIKPTLWRAGPKLSNHSSERGSFDSSRQCGISQPQHCGHVGAWILLRCREPSRAPWGCEPCPWPLPTACWEYHQPAMPHIGPKWAPTLLNIPAVMKTTALIRVVGYLFFFLARCSESARWFHWTSRKFL